MDEATVGPLLRICRALDGMPLAFELAAFGLVGSSGVWPGKTTYEHQSFPSPSDRRGGKCGDEWVQPFMHQ